MAAQTGLEPAKVVRIVPKTGEPLRMLIAGSGAEALARWAAGA
jgi:hypothetical protein